MNRKYGSFLLLIFICLTFVGRAQTLRPISLAEAIELGIKNSKNLEISRAKILEAQAMLEDAKNRKLPDFKITGSYLQLNSANFDLKSAGSGSSSNTPKISSLIYGMANASLPVYAGGRIRFGIESSTYLLNAARLQSEQDSNAIAYNIAEAYINLYKSRIAIQVVQENLQAARSRDTTFSNLEKNGLLAKNDLLKSNLQTTQTELALLDAQNDAKLANTNMCLLLGLPDSIQIETETSFLATLPETISLTDLEAASFQNRKDMQAGNLRIKAADLAIKSARAESLPSLVLTGGYVAGVVPNLFSVTNALNVGIGVQYNLANLWKSNASLTRAKAQLTEAQAGENLLEDAVRLQANKDFQEFILAKNKMDVYDKALAQSTENYRITHNKYANNLATMTELLEANAALLQAKLNVPFAKADAFLAYEKLLLVSGKQIK